ncbi:MAG: AAA family ATPase [Wolbachia endosymbiont of Tyrophagus putrescentiae]|nr:AAA family ATPase [Wolbachia endosymbiont of Tyrophagus putrescentiae]
MRNSKFSKLFLIFLSISLVTLIALSVILAITFIVIYGLYLIHACLFGVEYAMYVALQYHIPAIEIIAICIAIPVIIAVYLLGLKDKTQNKQEDPLSRYKMSTVKLKDVIISDEVKAELQEVCNHISEDYKMAIELLDCQPSTGYLFYGPPGTGKTLLARAIAGEAGLEFFSISASEFVARFAGQSANNVKDLFAQTRKKAPCVLFIDEIDSIGAERGSSNGSATQDHNKTLNQLLTEVNEIGKHGIILIAATNRLEVLDEALVRPGRFDKKICIPLPDLGSREKILRLYMKDILKKSHLNFKEIARKTNGYSGADLNYLVNEAKKHAASRFVEIVEQTWLKEKKYPEVEQLTVTMDDLEHVIVKLNNEKKEHINSIINNINNGTDTWGCNSLRM